MNVINVAVRKDPSSRGHYQYYTKEGEVSIAIADYNFIVSHRVRLLMAHMDTEPACLLQNKINKRLILTVIRHPVTGCGYQRIWWIGNIGRVRYLPQVIFDDFTPGQGHGLDFSLRSDETVIVQGLYTRSVHHFRMEMMLRPFALI